MLNKRFEGSLFVKKNQSKKSRWTVPVMSFRFLFFRFFFSSLSSFNTVSDIPCRYIFPHIFFVSGSVTPSPPRGGEGIVLIIRFLLEQLHNHVTDI
jgi:hypothetical protein